MRKTSFMKKLMSIVLAVAVAVTMAPVTCGIAFAKEATPQAAPYVIARAATSGKRAVKLRWNKTAGATKYVVYGQKCGKKYKKLKTLSGTALTVKKISGKKLKAHRNYKFLVCAYKGSTKIAASKNLHIITAKTNGKYANASKITASIGAKTLKPGATVKLGATVKVYKGKKHLKTTHGPKITFTSGNTAVAAVNSGGKVTAKAEGTANIYIQDISGIYAVTKITVKKPAPPVPEKYTVTFKANTAGYEDPQIEQTCGQKYDLPAKSPVKMGYEFAGWFTKETGGTKITEETVVELTADTTVYAQWNPLTYRAIFYGNFEGSDYQETVDEVYDSKYVLPENNPERTGYAFAGWWTKKEGGTEVTKETTVAGNARVYAHWNPLKYKTTFKGNYTGSDYEETLDQTYGAKYVLPENNPERTGYAFAGWFTDEKDGTEITKDTVVEITSAATVYAHWEDVTVVSEILPEGFPTGNKLKPGEIEGAWIGTETGQACAVSTVQDGLIFQNGTNTRRIPLNQILTQDGDNWKYETGSVKVVFNMEDGVLKSITLSGNAVIDGKSINGTYTAPCKVTFDMTYVDAEGPQTQYLTKDSKVTKPVDPRDPKSFYTFSGWFKDAKCTQEWNFDTDTVSADTTLYAYWTTNIYRIVNTNEKIPKSDDSDVIPDDAWASTTGDGKAFWTTRGNKFYITEKRGGTYVDVDKVFVKDGDNFVYESSAARWTCIMTDGVFTALDYKVKTGSFPEYEGLYTVLDKFTVEFDMQGHGTAPNAQKIYSGRKVTEPEKPTADGWEFGGWYKEKACETAWNFSADTVSADMVLHAKWTEKPVAECTAPVPIADLVYDGTMQTIATPGSTEDGTMYYAVVKEGDIEILEWDTKIAQQQNAGTYHIHYYVKGDENHRDSEEGVIDATIGKAKLGCTVTFNAIGCVSAPEAVEVPVGTTYSTNGNKLTFTKPDDKTVDVTVAPDDTHKGTATWDPTSGSVNDDTTITVSFAWKSYSERNGYMVCVWDIGPGNQGNGNTIVFGPASGSTNACLSVNKSADHSEGKHCIAEDSWEEINKNINEGHADYYNECMTAGCTHNVEIAGNDYFDEIDGQCSALYSSVKAEYRKWNENYKSSDCESANYATSRMRATLNGKECMPNGTSYYAGEDCLSSSNCLLSRFPEDLQGMITARTFEVPTEWDISSTYKITKKVTMKDKLWLPNATEIYDSPSAEYTDYGTQFQKKIGKADSENKVYDENGNTRSSWLRSPYRALKYILATIYIDGSCVNDYCNSPKNAIAPCFNLGSSVQ